MYDPRGRETTKRWQQNYDSMAADLRVETSETAINSCIRCWFAGITWSSHVLEVTQSQSLGRHATECLVQQLHPAHRDDRRGGVEQDDR